MILAASALLFAVNGQSLAGMSQQGKSSDPPTWPTAFEPPTPLVSHLSLFSFCQGSSFYLDMTTGTKEQINVLSFGPDALNRAELARVNAAISGLSGQLVPLVRCDSSGVAIGFRGSSSGALEKKGVDVTFRGGKVLIEN